MKNSNYDKFPEVSVQGLTGSTGWDEIIKEWKSRIDRPGSHKQIVTLECYHGVIVAPVIDQLKKAFPQASFYASEEALLPAAKLEPLVYPYVTDDPVFGYMTPLTLADLFDAAALQQIADAVTNDSNNIVFMYGTGASLVPVQHDLLIYADMPRWEIQLRFRRNEVGNIGISNATAAFAYQYKRAFFVDWRVCDKQKQLLLHKADYVLDTTRPAEPKMVTGHALIQALQAVVQRPFRVMPFFDPGPWGGQWLKEVCDLDRSQKNFAWGFDCVPEENSLLIRFGDLLFETPSINLVFYQPAALLGQKVYDAFGAEFPIRFDFLDTMQGGNLSLQVHPLKEYIREKFGMAYTQDESYYFLEAQDNAFVYLGLKENVDAPAMIRALEAAQNKDAGFDADKYVEKWPVRKHDHVLIPAGTVHCSGADSVVLEISATPYIFTFKLWDWGRMGLDGKPRPISLAHGEQVIQWDRTTSWTKNNLVNQFKEVAAGDGWREERTGLDEKSFIETRRHWFTAKVEHTTEGVVNVLNLVEGREAIVESPTGAFEPFVIHYAETFIVPASVGSYTIRPYGEAEGQTCATMKALVRKENLNDYRIN
ncbi:MAG: class I mannose-6-phosphate isomerase [Chitinophagaceae bacterium]|nr:class I mannose-6-phosphate isomerase [Chitinophagaceae bacterium]